jgi:hypothetical protein
MSKTNSQSSLCSSHRTRKVLGGDKFKADRAMGDRLAGDRRYELGDKSLCVRVFY